MCYSFLNLSENGFKICQFFFDKFTDKLALFVVHRVVQNCFPETDTCTLNQLHGLPVSGK